MLRNSEKSFTERLSFLGTVSGIVGAPNFQCANLIGHDPDFFEGYWVYVIWDAGGLGGAPQRQQLVCTGYVSATGDLAVGAFAPAIAIGDKVLLIHPSLAASITSGVDISTILALVSAELTLDEDNGVVTATGLGTEDNVYINAGPAGEFEPRVVKIDLDLMVGGDTTVIRYYERLTPGVGWWLMDYEAYSGIDGGLLDGVKAICVEMQPNRFGVRVTLEQTAGAVKNYQWQRLAEE